MQHSTTGEQDFKRLALGIEYDGKAYCGWQRQHHSPSVQQQLEQALSQVAAQPIRLFCAGRTDSGVHATAQVVHFDHSQPRPESAWLQGANNLLPKDIVINWCKPVDLEFHARFSAVSRSYRYIIYNSLTPNAILANKVCWHRRPLDEKEMQKGADYLIGQHNFTSFRASACQANTPVRTMQNLTVSRKGRWITIDLKANAFLHHMVRNIVGCLFRVGEGRESAAFVQKVLDLKDRNQAPDTARPDGLYLVEVGYPDKYSFPVANPLALGLR
ncbi:MAG: tRNA pseudouridine(38-40) synthase TruA [Enterobacterales bacterium]|nr:tRNA pseudouridine(38-40) synthase TruA [Enterobacterales bacterium]